MRLRVGIIGLGNHWESRYRPALRALSDRFEVRAVCAEVAMRAEQAAREFDAVPVDGFRAMLNREDVDAMLL
ncbi:MAG: Gfo/Idh/MocA family oxidoreductase, partial [Planctomycetes bacterium]|nr:Gfo/Idh/MocA family oxidoreductase [Planctomycetota bacterium]